MQRAYGTSIQQNYATYTYSLNGKQKTVKDANGNLTTYEYDGLDRMSKMLFPIATTGAGTSSTTDYEQYGYDTVGNRTSLRKRDGKIITYVYDGAEPGAQQDRAASRPAARRAIPCGTGTRCAGCRRSPGSPPPRARASPTCMTASGGSVPPARTWTARHGR